jgi:hypothetical protein
MCNSFCSPKIRDHELGKSIDLSQWPCLDLLIWVGLLYVFTFYRHNILTSDKGTSLMPSRLFMYLCIVACLLMISSTFLLYAINSTALWIGSVIFFACWCSFEVVLISLFSGQSCHYFFLFSQWASVHLGIYWYHLTWTTNKINTPSLLFSGYSGVDPQLVYGGCSISGHLECFIKWSDLG